MSRYWHRQARLAKLILKDPKKLAAFEAEMTSLARLCEELANDEAGNADAG